MLSILMIHPYAHGLEFPFEKNPPFAAAILVEAHTGKVLFEYNSETVRSPASTQKLLLQLVVMDFITDGRASLSDSIYTSSWASQIGGSQVYLKQGEIFQLEELLEAIAIASANDACVAVAEHIGGTVAGFVNLMNNKSIALRLKKTRCVNVHGLDDTPSSNSNTTTASDLATIAREIVNYQKILDWSSIRYKPFRNEKFMLYTTNNLLGRYPDLDGLKTGYTQRAGFCLVATAKRQNMRLISVVMGARSEKTRDQASKEILSWGFNHFSKMTIVKPNVNMGTVTLKWGVEPEVAAVTTDSIISVLNSEQIRNMRHIVELEQRDAPIAAKDTLGKLKVFSSDSLLVEVGLLAEKDVPHMSLWEMIMSYF